MDSLHYNYNTNTNQLNYIQDSGYATGGDFDIHDQPANNYGYDAIGNLIKDSSENISNITWNVYGKITEIDHSSVPNPSYNPTKNIYYIYDAGGNRIGKKTTDGSSATVKYEWYVRDASGNVMTTYTASGDSSAGLSGTSLKLEDQYIYGSNRLGYHIGGYPVNAYDNGPDAYWNYFYGSESSWYRGGKVYELTNHLGNVMVTISDENTGVPLATDSSLIDHYTAQMNSSTDYYPFGMQMPARNWNSSYYRYGFNGKESDNEVKGTGNQIDYGMRVYDPRIARFLSGDPITKKYPELTPYQFASNSPIKFIDLDGLEAARHWYQYDINDLMSWLGGEDNTLSNINKGQGPIGETLNSFNRNFNPVGIVTYNGYQLTTGKDLDNNQPASRVDALGNLVIAGIFHQAGAKLLAGGPTAQLEKQMSENAANISNKQATAVHANTESAEINTATKATEKEVANTSAGFTNKATKLKINNQNSEKSEDIVRDRLQSQKSSDEAILRKPRVYIGDGSSGKYATPDFAIYNTKTGQINRIVDAKDGNAELSKAQEQLNKYGGIFRGSSRARSAVPQAIKPQMIEVEKTNVSGQSNLQKKE